MSLFLRRTPRLLPLIGGRAPAPRLLSSGHARAYAKEDLMDKDRVNPTSTEYSKTGGDQAAAQEGVAFDPSVTSPEGQTDKAGDRPGGDAASPLNVSPGNKDVASWRAEGGGGKEKDGDKGKSAGKGGA